MFKIENSDYFMSKVIKKIVMKLLKKKLNSTAVSELKVNDFEMTDISETEMGVKLNVAIIVNKNDLFDWIENEVNRI